MGIPVFIFLVLFFAQTTLSVPQHYPHHPEPPYPYPHPYPPAPDYHEPAHPPPHYPIHPQPPPAHYPIHPQPPPPHYPIHPQPPQPPPEPEYCEQPAPPQHYIPPPPPPSPSVSYEPFPHSFSFGVVSSAFRTEGAWNQDGKVESIWDFWAHNNPAAIADGTNGDYAADAYNKLEEDVEILNNLTVSHYKFSIAWSRIFTACGEINEAGVNHYQKLLTLLRENQIEPIVAIYDNDLPQYLQDQGGFLCDQFTDWYLSYAKTLFELFGSHIKYWITFNSPNRICVRGYGDGTYAPGISDNTGVNEYVCAYNLLKAHAAAYHLYDDSYRPTQKGRISLAIDTPWSEPNTDCTTDVEAAELKREFDIGIWAHPVYIGDWPKSVVDRIGQLSEIQGLPNSRLPRWTRKEIEWIKDTHDYFSINFDWSTRVAALSGEECLTPSYRADAGVVVFPIDGDLTFGMRKLIVWVKQQYRNPSIIITEDGWNSACKDLQDDDRIKYIHDSLVNIRLAITYDNARVYGYTYYGYIDAWEDAAGYTQIWGLYNVDFECPTKPRTARKSAEYYQFVSKYGCIDDPCPPKHAYLHEH